MKIRIKLYLPKTLNACMRPDPAEVEKGNLLLHSEHKSQLQLQVLQVCLVEKGLDVVDGEPDEEVEGHDGHQEEEHHKEDVGRALEGIFHYTAKTFKINP